MATRKYLVRGRAYNNEAVREARALPPIAELSPAEKKIEKRAAQMHERFKRYVETVLSIAASTITILAAFLSGVSAGCLPSGTQSTRVADFKNIWGVSGHILNYGANASTVSDAQYIGITKWRDGFNIYGTSGMTTVQALVNAGLKYIGIPWMDNGQVGTAITVNYNITNARGFVSTLGITAIYGVDGLNEPNNFPIIYNGVSTGPAGAPTTYVPAANFMRDYYAAVKADANLKNVPVYSISLNGAEPDNAGVQWLTIPTPAPSGVLSAAGTQFADYANLHVYPVYNDGGASQFVDTTGDRFQEGVTGNFVTTYARGFAGYTQAQAALQPAVITEGGLSTNAVCAGCNTVDRPTQAKNLLSGLLNAWKEGFKLFAIYTFYEQGTGEGVYDGPATPKPSATALHNLSTIINDAGSGAATFNPGALNLTISGLPSTGTSLLLQKSTGQYELIIWNNVVNWNHAAGTPITVSPVNVTATLAAAATTINTYDPMIGTSPLSTASNATSATASLSDHPMIIEIIP